MGGLNFLCGGENERAKLVIVVSLMGEKETWETLELV